MLGRTRSGKEALPAPSSHSWPGTQVFFWRSIFLHCVLFCFVLTLQVKIDSP